MPYRGAVSLKWLILAFNSFPLQVKSNCDVPVTTGDWIILTAFIVAGAVGYMVYSKWAEEGLRRTEADMKSNLPLRVDQNTTLVDVKYERTHSIYWYVIDKPDQFDAQETARQVQIGVCTNADNSSSMKKEGFSYEYHYRTKEGLALTDFKITTCE